MRFQIRRSIAEVGGDDVDRAGGLARGLDFVFRRAGFLFNIINRLVAEGGDQKTFFAACETFVISSTFTLPAP